MSRRKEWHSPVTYIDGAGHRLIVGQHAFEINGGGNVSLFPKHAIAQIVRAWLDWEMMMEREVRLTKKRTAGLSPVLATDGLLGICFVRSRHIFARLSGTRRSSS